VPEPFQKKLGDPRNPDHNRQHLAHVGNNAIIGSAYDLFLASMGSADSDDAAKALMFGSFTHDHLQIDRQLKDGHDYLGGLFSAGLMRLAKLRGLPFTQRQESLAYYSVYWHSYPEKMTESVPPAHKLLNDYGKQFGSNDSNSLLFWLNGELGQRGVSLASLDCHLSQSDTGLANWLVYRLAAADKRASYAPPFLSVLRTMATGDKPFISKESLGRTLDYFMANIRNVDVLTRTIFEDDRDLRKVGFSAFEINWIKSNKVKKLDYLLKIASVLVNNDSTLITSKYEHYGKEVIYEAFRERTIDADVRIWLLESLPNLFSQPELNSFNLPQDLVNTLMTVIFEYQNAGRLMAAKGKELRSDLERAGMSGENFLSWLTSLLNEVKGSSQLRVVGRHTHVPRNLPIYCNSLGVVK